MSSAFELLTWFSNTIFEQIHNMTMVGMRELLPDKPLLHFIFISNLRGLQAGSANKFYLPIIFQSTMHKRHVCKTKLCSQRIHWSRTVAAKRRHKTDPHPGSGKYGILQYDKYEKSHLDFHLRQSLKHMVIQVIAFIHFHFIFISIFLERSRPAVSENRNKNFVIWW